MSRSFRSDRTSASSRPGVSRREMLKALGGAALAWPAFQLFGGFLSGGGPAMTHADNLALRFAKHYRPVPVRARPRIPSYPLPLDLAKVANFAEVAPILGLARDDASLRQNGFAVLPGQGN